MGSLAHLKKSTGDYMDNDERLNLIRLADGSMSKDLAINIRQLNSLYCNIDNLKSSADKLVLERIKESDMTIEECSAHARGRFICFDVDVELINIMARKSKTFEDVLETSKVFFHYRREDMYFRIFIKEYSKSENKVNWKEWFRYLTYKDSWYIRISKAIEQFVLSKIFETAPEEGIIDTINFYQKKGSHSFETMAFVLSKSNLPDKTWEAIRKEASTREELKKIWQIADEKIKSHQA